MKKRKSALPGTQWGQWFVLRHATDDDVRDRKTPAVQYRWCRCACGYEGVVTATSLTMGVSTRCRACADAGKRAMPTPPPNYLDHAAKLVAEYERKLGGLYADLRALREREKRLARELSAVQLRERAVKARTKQVRRVEGQFCPSCRELAREITDEN